jgi:hypothetical protein
MPGPAVTWLIPGWPLLTLFVAFGLPATLGKLLRLEAC